MLGEQRLKISPVQLVTSDSKAASVLGDTKLAPGELHVCKNDVFVGTATTPVRLDKVQAPGKKMMDAPAWARGSQPEGILA